MSLDPRQSAPSPKQHGSSSAPAGGPLDQYPTTAPLPAEIDTPITRLELFSTTLSPPFVSSISGAIGGIASGVVTCPLDVIKTKLQAQGGFQTSVKRDGGVNTNNYRGLVGTSRLIWREDGIRGMYRGLGPIILGYFPTWAVYFTVYDVSRQYWYTKLKPGEDQRKKLLSHTLASITAGGCSTLITNPIWVIKTRLMSQVNSRNYQGARPPWQYKSTWDAARKMYLSEGIRSFYSGLSPALLGLTHVAVQFPLYEYLKFKFTGLEMGKQMEGNETNNWLGMSLASFLSKICASSATYPHEVLRTRLQTQQRSIGIATPEGLSFRGTSYNGQPLNSSTRSPGASSSDGMRSPPRYRGIVQTFKTILREEGWRAFYVGMGTNMIRAVPAATTTILTYEFMVQRIRRLQSDGRRKIDLAKALQ
ncbi:MAG: Platinum sensitivity protein [Chaenotheca gracillima]|nr:MAG: Platinum sensitivity protein [Chaenotheca gracillima]